MRHCHHRSCNSALPPVARYCPRCGRRTKRGGAIVFLVPLVAIGAAVFVLAGVRPGVAPAVRTPAVGVEAQRPAVAKQSKPYTGPTRHIPVYP